MSGSFKKGETLRFADYTAVPEQIIINNINNIPGSGIVHFTFKHILSKVVFQFQTANQNPNLKMVVSEFSFTAAGKGDCEIRYTGVDDYTKIGANWNPSSGDGDQKSYEFFSGGREWSSGSILDEVYVIPQSNTGKLVGTITVDTYLDEEKKSTKTYTNVSLTIPDHEYWMPGYVYRYIADLEPEQHFIHFSTSVIAWRDYPNRNQAIGGSTTTP